MNKMENKTILSLSHLHKSFTQGKNKLTILDDANLEIKKGDCIGQAIFMPFLIADGDIAEGARTGGFGSTDKQ